MVIVELLKSKAGVVVVVARGKLAGIERSQVRVYISEGENRVRSIGDVMVEAFAGELWRARGGCVMYSIHARSR